MQTHKKFFLKNKSKNIEVLLIPLSILLAGTMLFVGMLIGVKVLQQSSLTKSDIKVAVNEALNNYSAANQDTGSREPNAKVKTSLAEAPILGNKQAKVALVEFSDYECPVCKQYAEQIYPLLKKDYVDSGRLIVAYRNNPLDMHEPKASLEARAALCVKEQDGDSKYYEYHDAILKDTPSNGIGFSAEQLANYAKQVGVNTNTFTKCLESSKYNEVLQKDIAEATRVGARGTPAFVIGMVDGDGNVDGELVYGLYPYSEFQKIIDSYLQK